MTIVLPRPRSLNLIYNSVLSFVYEITRINKEFLVFWLCHFFLSLSGVGIGQIIGLD